MANTKNFIAKNGFSTGDGYSMPDIRPSLLLDFANSKTLDPRITFTRGSTATYWDGHTTTKAEENLIPYSQRLDVSDWSKSSGTLTANTDTAPDGTTTADKFVPNTSTESDHVVYQSFTTVGCVASAYVKADGLNYVSLIFQGGTANSEGVQFNLSTGAVSATQNANGNITNVGNSWYRVELIPTTSQTPSFFVIEPSDGSAPNTNQYFRSTYAGDGTSGMLIWGAQVEQRDAVTAYTETDANPIVKYQPTLQTAASGEARFDHDPVTGESKGLLIEESRTNLVTYSEGTAGWTLYNNGTIKNDVAVAPDGTRAAQVFNYDGGTGVLRINTTALTNGTTYTMSVYLKSNNSDTPSVNLQIGDTTVVSSQALTNEWVRYSGSGTPAVTGYNFLDIEIPTGSDISIWGAQLEQAVFPTSYIPTSGSSASRSADAPQIEIDSTSDWYSNEGTLYGKFSIGGFETSQSPISLYDSTIGNNWMGFYSSTPQVDGTSAISVTAYRAVPTDSNSAGGSIKTVSGGATARYFAVGEVIQAAMSFSTTEYNSGGAGAIANQPGSYLIPSHNVLSLYKLYSGGFAAKSSHIRKVAFYPQFMTQAELEALTED
jgi:hypothetical protein